MGKINILTEDVCNRIAAGEVIERPFSVVKELVENSIDAGANEIEISIERGGKDLVKVVDNGCGIEKDDMRAAFFPHATSKITKLDDIAHIKTLGFRGEALATISSIALVELISSTDGENANKVECNGDYIGKAEPYVASSKGTQITVRNLFFNTPVRFKFLKGDKKEETDITAYVTRYILCRPDVSFRYYVDGKLKLQSYGGGADEAVTQLYGASTLPQCFKIEAERNDIRLTGFISNQQFFKSNKSYQTVFLNGRYINNQVISSAVNSAYAPYTMKKNFPFFVLYIEMNDELVDVNVHPNKTDVRFADSGLVYGTIYKIISGILDGTAKAADFVVPDDGTSVAENPEPTFGATPISVGKVYDTDFSDVKDIEQFTHKTTQKGTSAENHGVDLSAYENYEEPDFTKSRDKEAFAPVAMPAGFNGGAPGVAQLGNATPKYDLGVEALLEEERAKQRAVQEEFDYVQCKYRGTLFNTYIIYEIKDAVYLIDQHAAHERLIYDRLKEKMAARQVVRQTMFVPYILTVSPEEYNFLDVNKEALRDIGITIEPFGPLSFRVYEIPADLPALDTKAFFDELLSDVSELKQITMADILKDKLAQTACKHAIKGGEILIEQEREKLFGMLRGNLGLKCPHGRPVCLKLTKYELEKMFKRKV